MADIKDLLSDPEPIGESDAEIRREVFEIHHAMGKQPQDLVGAMRWSRSFGQFLLFP